MASAGQRNCQLEIQTLIDRYSIDDVLWAVRECSPASLKVEAPTLIRHYWWIDIGCGDFGVCLERQTLLPVMVGVGQQIVFDGEFEFVVSESKFDINDNSCTPTMQSADESPMTPEVLRWFVNERTSNGWTLEGGSYDHEKETFAEWCHQHGLNYEEKAAIGGNE